MSNDNREFTVVCADCGEEYPVGQERPEDHDESCPIREVLEERGL